MNNPAKVMGIIIAIVVWIVGYMCGEGTCTSTAGYSLIIGFGVLSLGFLIAGSSKIQDDNFVKSIIMPTFQETPALNAFMKWFITSWMLIMIIIAFLN